MEIALESAIPESEGRQIRPRPAVRVSGTPRSQHSIQVSRARGSLLLCPDISYGHLWPGERPLEGEFSYQRDAARVAGKYSLGIIEDGIPRSQIVQVARTVGPRKERSNVIHP
jgi:hypothetical protein